MRTKGSVAIGVSAVVVLSVLSAVPALAAKRLPNGPGPLAHYAVQPQPPAGACHYRQTAAHEPLPDPKCTMGALNPKVTQATLATTICKSGYTASIRPPSSVTGPEKVANAKSYGYKGSLSDAEYDHLVSLELGGDPNDRRNLWVEPPSPGHKAGSGVHNDKDAVENHARSLICSHKVTLSAMQLAIAANWTTAIAVAQRTPPPGGGSGGGSGGGPTGTLSCRARVSDAHPSQYSAVWVYVSTAARAAVTATAHYKSTDTQRTATAAGNGTASVEFRISRATRGYTVVVSIAVALGAKHASCATSFTPA